MIDMPSVEIERTGASQQSGSLLPLPSREDLASHAQKMIAAMKAIQGVAKEGKNTQQNYSYVRAEDIASEVRRCISEAGLAFYMTPLKEATMLGDKLWQQYFAMHLVDSDTGYDVMQSWYGTAMALYPNDDKVFNKIQTNAKKTFFIHQFVITTDAEKDLEDDSDEVRRRQDQQQQPPPLREVKGKKNQPPPPAEPPKQETSSSSAMNLPVINPVAGKQDVAQAAERVRNRDTFIADAKAAGFDVPRFKATLPYFGFALNADGTMPYQADKHDAMIEALNAWQQMCNVIQASLPEGEVLDETNVVKNLAGISVVIPYDAKALVDEIPVMQKYRAFVHESLEITDRETIKKIISEHNLLPWTPEKSDLMLETIRSQVEAAKIKEAIVEAADIEEVVGDSTEADSDLVEELFGGSSMKL